MNGKLINVDHIHIVHFPVNVFPISEIGELTPMVELYLSGPFRFICLVSEATRQGNNGFIEGVAQSITSSSSSERIKYNTKRVCHSFENPSQLASTRLLSIITSLIGLENFSIQHKKRITVGGGTITLNYYKKPTLTH
ncbi:hypothetical protein LXL04_038245 [Taraxacum kok-saghyz]